MDKGQYFKINAYYIIGILITAIILLITVKWNLKELVSYITFALTLTSLVLSLVAIIYSLISNQKFSDSIGELKNVSTDVLKTNERLNLLTSGLYDKIGDLPNQIMAFQLEKLGVKESINNIHQENINEKEKYSFNIRVFMSISSFAGLKILYACMLSYKLRKSFGLFDLFRDDIFRNYCLGFLVAVSSCGMIKYTNNEFYIMVNEINEYLEKNIQSIIYAIADNNDKNGDKKYLWKNDLEIIEKYFDNKN